MDKAAEFRARARECRRQAEAMTNDISKEQWLKIAQYWDKSARHAEKVPDVFR